MLRLKVLILLILGCLSFSEINASQPTFHISQPKVISDSSKFIDIVLNSDFNSSPNKWKIVDIEPPFYLDDIDTITYANSNYSFSVKIHRQNMDYSVRLKFVIIQDSIVNLDYIKDTYLKIIEGSRGSTQDSTVLYFIDSYKVDKIDAKSDCVYFLSREIGALTYYYENNPINENKFILNCKLLGQIDSLLKYVPLDSFTPIIKEFDNNLGIDYLYYNGNDNLALRSRGSITKPCGGELSYKKGIISYLLPSSFMWTSIPYYEKIRQIINDSLLVDSLSNCYLDSEGGECHHNYISIKSYSSYQDYRDLKYHVSVALKNKSKGGWKDAFMVLYPDSTFKDLKIKMDYQN